MSYQFNNCEHIQFKNWIKKRFINALDIKNLSYKEVSLWSQALAELSDELIDTVNFSRFYIHEIVPFRRGRG